MSLINDALKKAQNLQTRPAGSTATFPRPTVPATGNSTPTNPAPAHTTTDGAPATNAGPTSAPTPATATVATTAALESIPPRKGKSPHSGLIIGIAATVLVAGLGAIGYVVYALFFMGTPEEQTVVATTPAVTPAKREKDSAKENAPAEAAPADATADASTSAKTSENSAPAVASTAPAPLPASTTPKPAETGVSTPATPTPATTPATIEAAAAPAPAPEPVVEEPEERINNPKPHIQVWVDKITVSGIRPGDKPKALMNDRVFVLGDMVNRELGLQLAKITDRLLVFEDEEGNTYEYSF